MLELSCCGTKDDVGVKHVGSHEVETGLHRVPLQPSDPTTPNLALLLITNEAEPPGEF